MAAQHESLQHNGCQPGLRHVSGARRYLEVRERERRHHQVQSGGGGGARDIALESQQRNHEKVRRFLDNLVAQPPTPPTTRRHGSLADIFVDSQQLPGRGVIRERLEARRELLAAAEHHLDGAEDGWDSGRDPTGDEDIEPSELSYVPHSVFDFKSRAAWGWTVQRPVGPRAPAVRRLSGEEAPPKSARGKSVLVAADQPAVDVKHEVAAGPASSSRQLFIVRRYSPVEVPNLISAACSQFGADQFSETSV